MKRSRPPISNGVAKVNVVTTCLRTMFDRQGSKYNDQYSQLDGGSGQFNGVAGDYNVFQFTPSTLQGTDTITGGAAGGFFDVMVAQAAGTIGAAQFAGVTNIEQLFLSSGGNNVTLTNGLVAGTSFGFFAVIDGGGNDVIDASAITATPIVYYAGAGADTFIGGQGNDAVFFAPADLSSADTIQGGAGIDAISFNAAGTVTASAFTNVTGFELLALGSADNNVTLNNGLAAGTSMAISPSPMAVATTR